jgi:isoleucyl-tRNA synthetase
MDKKPVFQPVTAQVNFPDLEERVIRYWKDAGIFEKSMNSRPADKTWTFLDGPPFITGLPHYGTLLSSIPKDLFPRYWTMKGYRVRRVWGWDCHGLPAENKVEVKLKLKSKRDIEEKIGVKKFIDECKSYVADVSGEWEWYVDHIGRWVDFKNAYRTMDLPYMESVMWVFKQMYDKNLIYKGLRVSLYCPHDVTPISNFEVAMDADNYKEVTEPTAVFMYRLADEKDTYFLAWSTTPWNKLATPALAVNPDLTYVKVVQGNEKYIIAKSTISMLTDEPYKVIEEFSGSSLVGKKFEPHYNFYKIEEGKKANIVIPGDFVTADEGTGIVTIAAYGEEDLAAMKKENIQIVLHVDEEGVMKPEVPVGAGKYYLDVDPLVMEDLKSRGLIYRVDKYTHAVPTCWRCHTRLYYAPQDAWYVNVQSLKEKMKATNEKVHWYPDHFKYGRYLKSLENAPDWCISRSRYWGSPVPVWECPKGHRFVPGSIAELEMASGAKISDLHKPGIDEVLVKCSQCGESAKRVTEVLDSWIEAGSASLAEHHYPFNKEIKLEEFFPPDFIVEYTGQIRAWFYVLHVIATALFDSHAFKNVVVTGVILGTDGRKMSKNYGNYPDPKEMLQKYGGDALRLYLLGAPVMHGEDIRISELDYRQQVRGILLLLWNVYNFFVTYANVDSWASGNDESTHVLDRWILSRMNGNIKKMTDNGYEKYDSPEIVGEAWNFMRDLSLWYVRRIRERVGPGADPGPDKNAAYQTLWTVLTTYCTALAPLIPFVTEEIFRNLTGKESVHLESWPVSRKPDTALENDMFFARQVVERILAKRKEVKIPVRQPLGMVSIKIPRKELPEEITRIISDEVNIKDIQFITAGDAKDIEITLDTEITPELKAEGDARQLVREVQGLRKEKGCSIDAKISLVLPERNKNLSDALLSYIKKQTLASSVTWAENLSLSIG